MLRISSSIILIGIGILNIGCSAENNNRLECPIIAHKYELLVNGTMNCYEDENKTTCKSRLYNDFSNRIDVYIEPYLKTMKELDVKYPDIYTMDVELYACGNFCKNLRMEIIRLYDLNIQENRYQSLKNYIHNLKNNYANSLGMSFTKVYKNAQIVKHQPKSIKPIQKKLTLKNIPPKCRNHYKLYLEEKRTKNKNLYLLNATIYDLNSCLKKERVKK